LSSNSYSTGAEYYNREITKSIFLDFVDEPQNSNRRTQEGGLYASYTIGPAFV